MELKSTFIHTIRKIVEIYAIHYEDGGFGKLNTHRKYRMREEQMETSQNQSNEFK